MYAKELWDIFIACNVVVALVVAAIGIGWWVRR